MEAARQSAGAAKSLKDLRELPDEQLVAQHDSLIRGGNVMVGVNYYLQELARRDLNRQTRSMVRLTWFIAGLTLINVVAVIASLSA